MSGAFFRKLMCFWNSTSVLGPFFDKKTSDYAIKPSPDIKILLMFLKFWEVERPKTCIFLNMYPRKPPEAANLFEICSKLVAKSPLFLRVFNRACSKIPYFPETFSDKLSNYGGFSDTLESQTWKNIDFLRVCFDAFSKKTSFFWRAIDEKVKNLRDSLKARRQNHTEPRVFLHFISEIFKYCRLFWMCSGTKSRKLGVLTNPFHKIAKYAGFFGNAFERAQGKRGFFEDFVCKH